MGVQYPSSIWEFKNLDWISTSVDAIIVEDKWYTPLPTMKNVKAFYLIVEQTNNGGLAETIVVELTINGVLFTNSSSINSGDDRCYYFNIGAYLAQFASARQILSLDPDHSAPLETKSLQIRVRQTSAVDAVAAQIEVNLIYVQTRKSENVYEFKNLDWISTSVDAIVVEDKWYTPLPTTKYVKAFYLIVEQTNNGATDEIIVIELTVNGTVHTRTIGTAGSGTPYYMIFDEEGIFAGTVSILQMLSLNPDHSAPLETKSLKIRVRQTSAVDAVAAQIEVNMVYGKKEVD